MLDRTEATKTMTQYDAVELSEASDHHGHNVSDMEAGVYCATCAEIICPRHFGDNA